MAATRHLKGLSDTVKDLLGGLTLNKSEQCSDWNRRPLSRSQILYAALDAAILVELAHVMWVEASEPAATGC